MGIAWSYRPPRINAAARITAARAAAETAGAEVLLAVSQPLVPVDTGELVASGKVSHTGAGAAVSYTAIAADGYDYSIKQHEDLDLRHEHGQAKYLEQPMHSGREAMGAAMAAVLRAAL